MDGQFDKLPKSLAQTVPHGGGLKEFGLGLVGNALAAIVCCLPSVGAAPAQQADIKASNTGINGRFGW